METLTCSKCNKQKPLDQFRPSRGTGKYALRKRMCNDCWDASKKAIWKRYSETHNEERRQRWHNDPSYREANKIAQRKWRASNAEQQSDRNRNRWTEIRNAVIEKYGGKCECCGEARIEFLAIDHIEGNGTGTKDRKLHGGSTGIYRKLNRTEEILPGYRVLCHNCNSALGFYGYCPHQHK